ncbi:MAG: hypothetical protein ACRDZM_17430 [Acidimicrobiia bacterium]
MAAFFSALGSGVGGLGCLKTALAAAMSAAFFELAASMAASQSA